MHHKYPGKIEVIQVIRGLAALSLLFFHCKNQLDDTDSLKGTIDWLFNSGAAGVDIFFVISGFIMVYSTNGKYDIENRLNSLAFLYKRLVRIWPPYLIISIILLGGQFLSKTYNPNISLDYILKSLFFLPIEFNDAPYYGYPLLAVGWTLNYEVYFYIIFALSFLFKKYRYIFLFTYFIITLCIIPLVVDGFIDLNANRIGQYKSLYISFITNPMIMEFLVGAAIGLIYLNKNLFVYIRRNSPPWLPFLIILLVVWQYLSGFWGGHGVRNWGLGGSLLVFAAVFYFDTLKFPKFFVQLGEISYSLYLIHLPVQFFLIKIFEKNDLPVFARGQAALFLVTGLSIIAAYISYQLLEIRLSNLILRRSPSSKASLTHSA